MVHVGTTVPAKTRLEVSVLLNVWNGDKPEDVERSIRSILWQTALPSEILVVSDGPAGEVIRAVIQKSLVNQTVPFRLIETECPRGLWNARNVGIEAAQFEVVFLQDADDVMHPKRLEIQYPFMLDSQADVCGTWAVEFDGHTYDLKGLRTAPEDFKQLRKKILLRNLVPHSSVGIKRSQVIAIGGYRDVYLMEDYDLWLRLLAAGRQILITPQPLQALAVDQSLYQRRGGIRFIRSELAISELLQSLDLVSRPVRLKRLGMRVIYRVAPSWIRRLTNQRVLARRLVPPHPKFFSERIEICSSLFSTSTYQKTSKPKSLDQFLMSDPTRTKSPGL